VVEAPERKKIKRKRSLLVRAFTAASLNGSCSLKFRKIFKKVIKTISQQLPYNFALRSTIHFPFNIIIIKKIHSLSSILSRLLTLRPFLLPLISFIWYHPNKHG
jgi:hypothetical protein